MDVLTAFGLFAVSEIGRRGGLALAETGPPREKCHMKVAEPDENGIRRTARG